MRLLRWIAILASRCGLIGWLFLVGAVSLIVLGYDLRSEPHWPDESAYISQSFFLDLLLGGQHNDPTWLSFAALDLAPLPKYLIGLMLRGAGIPRPSMVDAS